MILVVLFIQQKSFLEIQLSTETGKMMMVFDYESRANVRMSLFNPESGHNREISPQSRNCLGIGNAIQKY